MAFQKPSTVQLARYFGVHRNTMKKYIEEFKQEVNTGMNLRDLATFIAFLDWMVLKNAPTKDRRHE